MKITKAKEKALTPATKKDYSRKSQQVAVNFQNEWIAFQQKAAELSSSQRANIIILAHFPGDSQQPTGINYVAAHGDVAKKYQHKDMLQLLANKFAKKCSQFDEERGQNKGGSVDGGCQGTSQSSECQQMMEDAMSVVIDNVATKTSTTFANPDAWPQEGEDMEVIAEEEVAQSSQSTTPVSPAVRTKAAFTTPSKNADEISPKVVTLSNFSPAVVKCYTVSKDKENSNRRVLQAVQLRPKPLEKPVFHANGHTYASLDDGTVIKVVPVQFAREESKLPQQVDPTPQDESQEGEVILMDSSEGDHSVTGRSESPELAGCVEVIMSSELTQAIEAMNNDLLAQASSTQIQPTMPATIDGGASSSSCSDNGRQKIQKRGRPRKATTPEVTVPTGEYVGRASRNDRANYRFKCDQCSRTFRDSFDLKVHLRTHTGEKPFKCDQCDQSFSLKCTLKVHQLIHTGERPFQCHQCEKSFTRSDYLTRHMTHHTGEKPFTCPHKTCQKTFALRGRLNKHQRSFNHYGESTTADPLLTTP